MTLDVLLNLLLQDQGFDTYANLGGFPETRNQKVDPGTNTTYTYIGNIDREFKSDLEKFKSGKLNFRFMAKKYHPDMHPGEEKRYNILFSELINERK